MNDSSIKAMASYDESSLSRAFAGAAAFAGDGGRIATMADVVDARLATPRDASPWRTFHTTATAEYYGLSRGGVPVAAVLHGTGPLSTVGGIEAAYAHEVDDFGRARRVGRVGLPAFHRILDGLEGPVDVVDADGFLRRREFPFGTVTAEEALAEPLFVARLGGRARAEAFLARLVADDDAWHREAGHRSWEGFVLSMDGSSDSPYDVPGGDLGRWTFAARAVEGGMAMAHLLATGTSAFSSGGRGRGTSLQVEMGLHDHGDGVRFVGLRAGAEPGAFHPGFALERAVATDDPRLWRPHQGAPPDVVPLVALGERRFTQVPKSGCSLDTEEPELEVTSCEELPGPGRFEVETAGHHVFFRYDVEAVRAVAPEGANAYEVHDVSVSGDGRRQSAGISFFRVEVAEGRRLVRTREVMADPALMVELTAAASACSPGATFA